MKAKPYLYLLMFCTAVLLLASCQHNDICTAESPSTPKIVIRFYDINRLSALKTVKGLNVREIHSDKFYFEEPVTDSMIALPLRTNAHTTTYELIINLDDSVNIRKDTIKLTYATEEEYISRACGFRDIFTDVKAEGTAADSWIKDIRFVDTTKTVKDEKNAHLYIYH